MSTRAVVILIGIALLVVAALALGEMSYQNCVDNARADNPIEEADDFGRLEQSTEGAYRQIQEYAIEKCDRLPF